jgi:hypothetical protein
MRLKKVISFLRWRIKQVRYATKWLYWLIGKNRPTTSESLKVLDIDKFNKLGDFGYVEVKNNFISDISFERLPSKLSQNDGKAVIDVYDYFLDETNILVSEILSDVNVSSLVNNYFDHKPWLWNVSVSYTVPKTEGIDFPLDSQMWHFDYGDKTQLHLMYYLSDIDEECGPLTFVDAIKSSKIKRHYSVIERVNDNDLKKFHDIDPISDSIKLTGDRGSLFVVDPGRLLHQGARCQRPRMVLFVSITSRFPMSKPNHLIGKNKRLNLKGAYKESESSVYNDNFFL